ncbi:hypothetical protein ACJ3XI_08005 [Litorimonas sp. RW-G-Af-16]|uniref:hypothetical protein n=1 Tax=Litorimonas sp. RW-G-Af-16 TaxID=3241168 RepID=UPI00390C7A74
MQTSTRKSGFSTRAKWIGLAMVGVLALSGCKSTKETLQIGDAGEKNPGPCPRAFALYDAARIVEFRGQAQRFDNVGFTGEVLNVRSLCRYYSTEPIVADLDLTFELGRGPAASAQDTATYEYFVAVTRKNAAVIEKQTFPLQVTFPAGKDRITVVETIDKIVIPRATETTSGVNFEIVVGFVVTPEQRDFNAQGKRFRINAGQN